MLQSSSLSSRVRVLNWEAVIDTRNIYMSLELSLEQITSGKDTAATIRPYFINNIAHSLWQNVEVFVAGTQVTNANNLYPFKSIVEADLSFEPSAKTGILACQGYSYEPDPTVFNKKEEDLPIKSGFNNRRDIVDARRPWKHWFTLNDSFLAGIDKNILPGFPLRIRLTRSTDPFLLLQPEGAVDAKNYTIKVLSASLFVHMLELRTETFLSIERALSKKAAQYDWREDVMVSFVITSGTSIYFRDDIFNRAPVSHLIMLMVPEKSFTGSYHTNPFHFSDFALDTISVTREGQTVGNTPIEVRSSIPGPSDKRPQGEEPKKTLIQATNPAPYSNTKSKKKSTVNLPREKSRRRKIQVLLSLLQDCRNLRINLAKKSIRLSSGRAEVSLVNLLRKLSSPKSDFDKSLKPFVEALLQDYSKEQLSNLFLNPSAITFLNTKDSSL